MPTCPIMQTQAVTVILEGEKMYIANQCGYSVTCTATKVRLPKFL